MLNQSFLLKSNLSSHKIRLINEITHITYDDLIEFGFYPSNNLIKKSCFKLALSNNSFQLETFSNFECFLEIEDTYDNSNQVKLKEGSCYSCEYTKEIKIFLNGDLNKKNYLYIITDTHSDKRHLLGSPDTNEKTLNEIIQKYSIFKTNKESVNIDMNLNFSIEKVSENKHKNVVENSYILYNSNAKRVRDKDQTVFNFEAKVLGNIKENKNLDHCHKIYTREEKKEIPTDHSNKKIVTPIKKKRKRLIKSKLIQMSSPKNTCAICLDTVKTKTLLNKCKHEFCYECIDNWSKMTNLCPLCKEEFTKLTYYVNNEKRIKEIERKKLQLEEEELEDEIMEECFVCGRNDNESLLLVCDYCDYYVCHTYCDNLKEIPEGEWKCFECRDTRLRRFFQRMMGEFEDDLGKSEGDSSFESKDSKVNSNTFSQSRYYLRSRVNSQNHNRESFSSNRVLNLNLSLSISTNSINLNLPQRSTRYNLRNRNRSQN